MSDYRGMIAFSAALKWEVRPILRSLRNARRENIEGVRVWIGEWTGRPALVYQTGVGIPAATSTTASVVDRYPVDLLINSGCAGGLVPEACGGTVVVPNAVLGESDTGLQAYTPAANCSEELRAAIESAKLSVGVGALLTSPTALMTAAAKEAAHRRSGAIAVDMETAAVAAVAAKIGLPFASIRVVLDGAASALPEHPLPPRDPLKIAAWGAQTLRRPAEMRRLFALANDLMRTQRILDRCFKTVARQDLSRRT